MHRTRKGSNPNTILIRILLSPKIRGVNTDFFSPRKILIILETHYVHFWCCRFAFVPITHVYLIIHKDRINGISAIGLWGTEGVF